MGLPFLEQRPAHAPQQRVRIGQVHPRKREAILSSAGVMRCGTNSNRDVNELYRERKLRNEWWNRKMTRNIELRLGTFHSWRYKCQA
jgi:hypothetical protein